MEDIKGLGQKDYQDAIFVQDACNLSGVVRAWSRLVGKIWEDAELMGKGTDWVNKHPINVLFASKVASLTGCEIPSEFSKAYDCCVEKAKT